MSGPAMAEAHARRSSTAADARTLGLRLRNVCSLCLFSLLRSLFEANNGAMQTAIHTQTGGKYGSGNCDRNGCFARVGGPRAPHNLQRGFGVNDEIDAKRPFKLHAQVDNEGSLEIQLQQDHDTVKTFTRSMAGNPQGKGVPANALPPLKAAQGKLILVASLWASPDLSWLDGTGCNKCNLNTARMKVKLLSKVEAPLDDGSKPPSTSSTTVEDGEDWSTYMPEDGATFVLAGRRRNLHPATNQSRTSPPSLNGTRTTSANATQAS